jgi:hypothetical protein
MRQWQWLMVFGMTTAVLGAEVTYTKEVSRILAERCEQCHRQGDIAPMSLQTYQEAAAFAPDIKRVLEQGLMPPWKPTESHGKFKGAFALKPEERADVLAWIAAGAPMGRGVNGCWASRMWW